MREYVISPIEDAKVYRRMVEFTNRPEYPRGQIVRTIQDVAKETGIDARCLRAWEKRYGWPKPERYGNRFRKYSDQDVADLKRVKAAIEGGLRIGALIMGGKLLLR